MDAVNGFKLLADSNDVSFFAPPRSPQFSPQQEVPNNYYGYNDENKHPLLGHDVQVVQPSPYQLPPFQNPAIIQSASAIHQQHSPKQLPVQPQQASPKAQPQMQMLDIKQPIKLEQPKIQVAQPSPVYIKGLINQQYDESDASADDEDISSILDDDIKVDMHAPLEPAMKNVLVCLIQEYLSEVITFRMFLTKARQCLCAPDSPANNKEVFLWVVRCMLEGGVGSSGAASGHVQRMASFLEENGATKQEIEASSAAISEGDSNVMDYDIGEKRKRREKKSISRGLRSAPNKWCKAESQMLIRLVHENGDKSWKRIAEQLGGGKTGAQCAQHWKRVLSPQIRKGSWDDQEEELLLALVERYGQSWKNIAGEIKTRTDIQCRYQFQKSCLSRQCEWQPQEDALLAKKVAQVLHESSGSNNPSRMNPNSTPITWVEVAKFIARAKLTKIPRTALECKQRWYAINGNALPTSTITATNALPPLNLNSNITNNITSNIPSPNTIPNTTPYTHINTTNNIIPRHITPPTQPRTTPTSFHNINYSNINNNFTMVTQTY